MEFSGQTLVGESAWDSEVLPGVLIINVLIRVLWVGAVPGCWNDLSIALWGCHLVSPAWEDSHPGGGVAGSTQKTYFIHFKLNTTLQLVAKNGASGCFSLCNNNKHSYLLTVYVSVS